MNSHGFEKSAGYTVIEILSVIVIAAFLTAVFIYYYSLNDTELASQTNIFKTHIRYAQSRAMNTDTRWGVRFEASQESYWLFKDPDINDRITLPGQAADLVDLGEMGLDISGASFNITFDGWGRPALTARTFTNGQLAVNLNRDGTNGDPITITANTGFIP